MVYPYFYYTCQLKRPDNLKAKLIQPINTLEDDIELAHPDIV